MSIIDILDQLDSTYGKPDTITLLHNDTLFRSAFNPMDAPESLFYRIEQCQEIQVLARDPYSAMQIINNAIRLLMQSNIFPLKEFEDWEAITPKTYGTQDLHRRCIYAPNLGATATKHSRTDGICSTEQHVYHLG